MSARCSHNPKTGRKNGRPSPGQLPAMKRAPRPKPTAIYFASSNSPDGVVDNPSRSGSKRAAIETMPRCWRNYAVPVIFKVSGLFRYLPHDKRLLS
jgi:hypothetical protein